MTNDTIINAPAALPYLEIERVFDAPLDLVYRVSTDPYLVAKWIGPRGIHTDVVEYDVRTGGAYCYRQTYGADVFVFRGVYHTVIPRELTIATFEFDGAPNQVTLETTTYEDLGDGHCQQRTRSVFPSIEARDAALASGMEEGIKDSYARIEETVADVR